MKNSKIQKAILFICLFFTFGSIGQLHSQPGLPGFDDDVNDAEPAPINGLIGIALAVGAYFGARKIKQKKGS